MDESTEDDELEGRAHLLHELHDSPRKRKVPPDSERGACHCHEPTPRSGRRLTEHRHHWAAAAVGPGIEHHPPEDALPPRYHKRDWASLCPRVQRLLVDASVLATRRRVAEEVDPVEVESLKYSLQRGGRGILVLLSGARAARRETAMGRKRCTPFGSTSESLQVR